MKIRYFRSILLKTLRYTVSPDSPVHRYSCGSSRIGTLVVFTIFPPLFFLTICSTSAYIVTFYIYFIFILIIYTHYAHIYRVFQYDNMRV